MSKLETTVYLAENEVSRVSRKKRSVRPSYWDSGTSEEIEISPDMEAFLILLPASVKTSMADYIKKATEFEGERSDRDALLHEFVLDDLAQQDDVVEESENSTSTFSSFLTEFDPGKFGDVEEVVMLMTDLNRGFPERTQFTSRSTFMATQAQVVSERLQSGSFWGGFDSPEGKKQFRSWMRAILAYAL